MADTEVISINVGGETYELTRHNSRLFTFFGRIALENGDTIDASDFNHVYHIPDTDNEEERRALYFFGDENVRPLGTLMLQNHFPASLNGTRVDEADRNAYNIYLSQQSPEAGDFVPEEWT